MGGGEQLLEADTELPEEATFQWTLQPFEDAKEAGLDMQPADTEATSVAVLLELRAQGRSWRARHGLANADILF